MSKVQDIDHGWKRIKRSLKRMDTSYTKVGVQQGTQHKSKEGELSDLVTIAVANEYGTKRIPSRPFMRNAMDNNQTVLFKTQLQMYGEVIAGTKSVYEALAVIGEVATTKIKKEIRNLKFPPNAPSTIARKKSDNPLIDQGQLVQSITHVEVMR